MSNDSVAATLVANHEYGMNIYRKLLGRVSSLPDRQEEVSQAAKVLARAKLNARVADDLLALWMPRMLKAIRAGKKMVNNKWSVRGSGSDEYIQELRRQLGTDFDVTSLSGSLVEVVW